MKIETHRIPNPKPVSNSNMVLWNAVSETDPAMTRRVNQRGGFTAIDSYYQIRRATELFGPLGQGWGYDAEFKFEQNLAIAIVSIWYTWNGKKSEPFTVCATNQLITHDKSGTRQHVDEDAAKKALTDALTKGLSYLGFSSDVFMGKFDDNRYVESLNQRLRGEEQQEELRQEILSIEDEMQLAIEAIEDEASYRRAREQLIPMFLRLKVIAPKVAVSYESAMMQLKRKFTAAGGTSAVAAAPAMTEESIVVEHAPAAPKRRKSAISSQTEAAPETTH